MFINTPVVPLKPSSQKWAKCIPVFRPKRLKNPTRWGSTYLHGLYKGVPPPPHPGLRLFSCLKGHPVPDNNKKPLRAAFSLTCLKITLRNEEAINSTRNKTDLLAKCFLLPILSTSILFTCFWFDLVRVLATTGNTSAVEIDSLFQTKMAKKPYPLAWHIPRYSL